MPVYMQNIFSGGELSPQSYNQVDLDRYPKSVASAKNFHLKTTGYAQSRNGTKYVAKPKINNGYKRLIRFEYRDALADTFVIEAGQYYMRFFQGRGAVIDTAPDPDEIYEISTPYTAADLEGITTIQRLNVMYICHPDHPMYTLRRDGATDWALAPFVYKVPPFGVKGQTESSIKSSATTGTVTLTNTDGDTGFFTNSVGRSYYFEENVATKHDAWVTGKSYTAGDTVVSFDNVYEAQNSATSGVRNPVHFEGEESDGGVTWLYLHSGWGYATVTAQSGATATATVKKTLPESVTIDPGTKAWAVTVIDAYNNPTQARFFNNRLCLCAGEDVALSVPDAYDDFSRADDEAIVTKLLSGEAQFCRWMMDDRRGLVIGTADSEWMLYGRSNTEGLTLANLRADRINSIGSSSIAPVRADNKIWFVSANKRGLYTLQYDYSVDGFIDQQSNRLAEHLFSSAIKKIIYQRTPSEYIWVLLENGQLIQCNSKTSENVQGFSEFIPGGTNAKVIESEIGYGINEGKEDLYLIVERTINGITTQTIEVLETSFDNEITKNSYCLDCGLTYSGSATTSISGLDHLNGETVTIFSNGNVTTAVVSSGAVTLSESTTLAHIGIPYLCILKLLPFSNVLTGNQQSGLGTQKNYSKLRVMVWNSLGGRYKILDSAYTEFAYSKDVMDTAQELYTGFVDLVSGVGWTDALDFTIEQHLPVPLNIQAVIMEITGGAL